MSRRYFGALGSSPPDFEFSGHASNCPLAAAFHVAVEALATSTDRLAIIQSMGSVGVGHLHVLSLIY